MVVIILPLFQILNLFLALLLGSFAALSYEEEMKNFNSFQNKVKWTNLKGKFVRIASIFTTKKVTPAPGMECLSLVNKYCYTMSVT